MDVVVQGRDKEEVITVVSPFFVRVWSKRLYVVAISTLKKY